MAEYILFTSDDGGTILVEVEEQISSYNGIQKAGLKETAEKTVAAAKKTFEEAIEKAVQYNAKAFIQSVTNLPVLPAEAELTFGLKATGEVGNIAIAKAGGETNYTVKLTWKRETKSKPQDEK